MTRCAIVLLAAMSLACSTEADAPTSPQPFTAADDAAIRSLIAEWDRAWAAGDYEAVVAMYTEDYVEILANAVEGPEGALARYQNFTITYSETSSEVRRLEGRGDLAYAWVSFGGRFMNADGERRVQSGNSLWVLKRDAEGEWRFAATAFGSTSQADTSAG